VPVNVLVVYAHPNPKSFNHAILEVVDETLRAQGHETCIKDLYGEGFNPLLDGPGLFAANTGQLAPDIRGEQEQIQWAEGLVFIYPLWWFDRPAILKGWFDRVFTNGFAFRYGTEGYQGLLKHEKAMVIVTTGGGVEDFARISWKEHIVRPTTDGTLSFCGVRNIVDKVFYAVPATTLAQRKGILEEIRELARGF
jgi:NAD(P)H dehydrogenase (quinone)